jgi:hypothetical protein
MEIETLEDCRLIINFPNRRAAQIFMTYMCEYGEQSYFDWISSNPHWGNPCDFAYHPEMLIIDATQPE